MNLLQNKKPKLIHVLLWVVSKNKKTAIPYFFLSILWAVNNVYGPKLFGDVLDDLNQYNTNKELTNIIHSFSYWIGFWVLIELGFRIRDFFEIKMPKLTADTRYLMYCYIQQHSYGWFSNQFAGALGDKITDMSENIKNLFERFSWLVLPTLMALMMMSVQLFQIKWWLTAAFLIYTLIHIGLFLAFMKKLSRQSIDATKQKNKLMGYMIDTISGFSNMKLFANLSYEQNNFQKSQAKWVKLAGKTVKTFTIINIFACINFVFTLGVGVVGGSIYGFTQGWLTIGEVTMVCTSSLFISHMLWILGFELNTIFKEIGVCREALKLIQTPHEIQDADDAERLNVSKGKISVQNLSFGYNSRKILFNDLNLEITAGSKVGLVGFSGSGKTTLVNLLLRFYDLHDGLIAIDGQNIAKVTQDSLRENIAMIPQDPILFHRSLLENIRYGRIDATDEEVIEAAKQAMCHEFILDAPEQYHTLVGERGIKLSGGQRQRIAFARAILKNAPILVLDEATSALDSVTEKAVQKTMTNLMQHRTTLVIAHRLSTLAEMDRILVFDKGKLVEDGSHKDLINANGHYAMLWNLQMNGFLPENQEAVNQK